MQRQETSVCSYGGTEHASYNSHLKQSTLIRQTLDECAQIVKCWLKQRTHAYQEYQRKIVLDSTEQGYGTQRFMVLRLLLCINSANRRDRGSAERQAAKYTWCKVVQLTL